MKNAQKKDVSGGIKKKESVDGRNRF